MLCTQSVEGILNADVHVINEVMIRAGNGIKVQTWIAGQKVRGVKIRNQNQDVSMAQMGAGAGAALGFGDVGKIMW
jgi:hypothetical protein